MISLFELLVAAKRCTQYSISVLNIQNKGKPNVLNWEYVDTQIHLAETKQGSVLVINQHIGGRWGLTENADIGDALKIQKVQGEYCYSQHADYK